MKFGDTEKPVHRIENHRGYVAQFVDTSMIEFRKTFRFAVNQTDADILTPTKGYRLCLRNISSRSSGNTGTIKMDFATSGKAVYDHYVSVNSKDESTGGHIVGDIDEPLTLNTTTGANEISVSVVYTEHK